MCGIAGYVVKREDKPIERDRLLDQLLLAIDHRGGDATGFVARNRDGRVVWHKASCDARRYVTRRPLVPAMADAVVGHTRYATNGHESFPENNHPVRRGHIYVTHNGIVTNDWDLFNKLGRAPFGEVDSEVIAAGLSALGPLGRLSIPILESLQGTAAIAAMDERDGTVLLARVSGSPLWVMESRRLVLWASEANALYSAHAAAIGSLGRLKADYVQEGEAIVLRSGAIVDTFKFQVPKWEIKPWKAPAVSCTLPATITPSSTAPHVSNTAARAIAAEDWPRIPLGDGMTTCDACEDYVDDLYDLYDGFDVWNLCEGCWSSLADTLPQSLRQARVLSL